MSIKLFLTGAITLIIGSHLWAEGIDALIVEKNQHGQFSANLAAILPAQMVDGRSNFLLLNEKHEAVGLVACQGKALFFQTKGGQSFVLSAPREINFDSLHIEGDAIELQGDFEAAHVRARADELIVKDKLNASHVDLDVTTTRMDGSLNVSHVLNAKGTNWFNGRSAQVKVGEFFQAKFLTYNDDGLTEVMGLALINAEKGRLNGTFNARNALVFFNDDLVFSRNAILTAENHIALHSHKNVFFDGQVRVGLQKTWPKVKLAANTLTFIKKLAPAQVIVSAKGQLTKSGTIVTRNSSISYSAGGKFESKGGASRSGFFEGNSQHYAAAAALINEQVKSFDKIFLSATNLTIDQAASVFSKNQTIADIKHSLHNYGDMESLNHILKAGRWFDNTGFVTSGGLLMIDTAISTNRMGGSMTADRAVINADYLAANVGGNISARNTEINSLIDLNVLGRTAGTASLTINAPLLNANIGGWFQSNNFTANSLVNFSRGGLVTRSPSLSFI